ncbi:hypothetical protein MKX01_019242 [Papaver californicum]|nr:hypothetical protein MKX01_019242 [Papaver californicum]
MIFRFGCLRSQTTSSDRSSSDEKPYMEMESVISEDSSNCNTASTTLDGVDIMGERLADEVLSVVKRRPEHQKISFVAHSLGGLVARYAIGRLYFSNPEQKPSEGNGDCSGDGSGSACLEKKLIVKIAGLEPLNFITVATPHLGSRGHRQVPVFCGLRFLEKTAKNTSWLLGRTGKYLFLIDEDKEKPPLLLQMANDCGDLRFMSAFQSFKRRAAYANVGYDQMWKTRSSGASFMECNHGSSYSL